MTPRKPCTHPDQLPPALIDLFHEEVARAVRDGDCLLWPGQKDPDGYGIVVHRKNGRTWAIGAHRLAKLLELGELPDWAVADHTCRVHDCFELTHLRLVTNAENIACGLVGQSPPPSHCKAGHPLSGPNLHLIKRSDGRTSRSCRRCRYLAKDRYRRRKRQAAV